MDELLHQGDELVALSNSTAERPIIGLFKYMSAVRTEDTKCSNKLPSNCVSLLL